jgi:type IV secretory pathway VirB10-like protein
MSEQDNITNIPEVEGVTPAEEQPVVSDKKSGKVNPAEKPKKVKAHRMTKEEKAAAREAAKNKSKRQKEWEDSLVANKRVKREEMKRKMKRAMLILLVFSLILTSVVYIMLLFIDENNIRITASSKDDKSISLSFDKVTWTPYLDVDGPDNMWNISYNPVYKLDEVPSIGEINAERKSTGKAGDF